MRTLKSNTCSSRSIRIAAAAALSLCLGATTAGCDKEEEGASDPEAPFGPVSENTKMLFLRENSDGSTEQVPGGIVGEKEIDGEIYSDLQVGDTQASEPTGANLWIQDKGDGKISFIGGELYSRQLVSLGLVEPGEAAISGTLDEPLEISSGMEVGETLEINSTGEAVIAGEPGTATVQGTLEVTAEDLEVETELGVLSGCKSFHADLTVTGDSLPAGMEELNVVADTWYHEQYGIVAAKISAPPFEEYNIGLLGSFDYVDLPGGYRMIQKMGFLDAYNGTFSLSTYDAFETFDADKDTHAKMLLELRFLDEEAAKSPIRPTVTESFEAGWGYFPSELVQADKSFFHPDENGKGFVYWIGFVDQAAKNDTTNPLSFNIYATLGSTNEQVRATARIIYKVYSE